MPHREDLIGIPERPIGPGRAGSTPAARKGLLRRRVRGKKKPDLIKQAVAQATI
jgi:hypothetical protein